MARKRRSPGQLIRDVDALIAASPAGASYALLRLDTESEPPQILQRSTDLLALINAIPGDITIGRTAAGVDYARIAGKDGHEYAVVLMDGETT